MPSDESDLLDDKFGELGSDYGSSGTYSFCAFSLCFDDSIGSVSVLGSEVFAPTGVSPKVEDSLKYFGSQISDFFPNSQISFIVIV